MRAAAHVSGDVTKRIISTAFCLVLLTTSVASAQSVRHDSPQRRAPDKTVTGSPKPKLVVLLVVDQMRADYIDKFQHQWIGGLRRLVHEGAWFHDAAYPYAETETCVGHSTISTGALPATHGMVANEWWDRDQQKRVTCTSDATAKNVPYGGQPAAGADASTETEAAPGDSAAKLLLPSFADELKFQSGSGTRIVTMSLKARAAITLAGHQGDSVTWFDGNGAWLTSTAYPLAPFVEEFVKSHPLTADYGKTWAPLLPESAYLYEKTAYGAGSPAGYNDAFPHPLRGTPDSKGPDRSFYTQWATSPYADTYLAQMADAAVDNLQLGKGPATDFLGIGFSAVDYVGHTFGPRSWEVQDELARLDRDLGAFFQHLDNSVGRGNYIVALSSDHGVAPIPEDLHKKGIDAGRLNVEAIKSRVDQALEPFNFSQPAVAEIGGANVYFTPGTYAKLKSNPHALQAALDAIQAVPGVARVYQSEDVEARAATQDPFRAAESAGYFKARSGDLLVVPKLYWIWDYSRAGKTIRGGTSHGTPYYYDQRVPIILLGWGIRPGNYFDKATPADIAPTLATLCGITLAVSDGRALREALDAPHYEQSTSRAQSRRSGGAKASAHQ